MWGELRAALSDAAGAEVLREVIIDRELKRRLKADGVTITDRELAAEESLLLTTLSDDAATAIRLLETLRDLRRLGPARYQQLLWRNAALRAIVRDEVNITDAAVEQIREVAYGPKRQVRVITTPDLPQAQYITDRVRGGAFFGDLAVEFSSDTSAARGGLLEPVGRLEPSYPAALLQAIWALPGIGAISDPVLLDRGYAVVRLEREIEAVTPDAGTADRETLEQLVRLNQERVLMDDLARGIIADAAVTIFDDDLNEAWTRFARTNSPGSASVR